jgi:hypothetical protein
MSKQITEIRERLVGRTTARRRVQSQNRFKRFYLNDPNFNFCFRHGSTITAQFQLRKSLLCPRGASNIVEMRVRLRNLLMKAALSVFTLSSQSMGWIL